MKKIPINILCSFLTISLCGATLDRPQEFPKLLRTSSELVPNQNKIWSAGAEPTCEELKTMWRFSKRQSRAAEITNEIPTYRDPFVYNVWDQYPRIRSTLSNRRITGRPWSKPVYGRLVRKIPKTRFRYSPPETNAYDEVMNYFDFGNPNDEIIKKYTKPKVPLDQLIHDIQSLRKSKFQKLKDRIRSDRLKELRQQRSISKKLAMPKNIPQYDENILTNGFNKINNNDFDEEGNTGRMRLLIDDIDDNDDSAYAPEGLFWIPYRERSAFDSETSDERFW